MVVGNQDKQRTIVNEIRAMFAINDCGSPVMTDPHHECRNCTSKIRDFHASSKQWHCP
jgi:hypothetical protein